MKANPFQIEVGSDTKTNLKKKNREEKNQKEELERRKGGRSLVHYKQNSNISFYMQDWTSGIIRGNLTLNRKKNTEKQRTNRNYVRY